MNWIRPLRVPARLAALLALAATTLATRASAQPWSLEGALTGSSTDALAIDGIGLSSGPITTARGSLVLAMPSGSTIVSAVLYTTIRMRNDVVQPPVVPGSVALSGTTIYGGLPGRTIPTSTVLASRCASGICYFTARTDVTMIVDGAYRASVASPFTIEVSEMGDGQLVGASRNLGDAFAYLGHTLVVRYRNSRVIARQRFSAVWFGASDERDESLTLPLPAPRLAVCAPSPRRVAERDERVTISVTVGSEENDCGEFNDLVFTNADSTTATIRNIGGADDATPAPPRLDCLDSTRASDLRALLTTGTFGSGVGIGTSASAQLFGSAVGYDNDDVLLAPPAPRRNDELFSLPSVPTRVRLTQGTSVSPYKTLSVLAMQFPLDGDSDSDGHSDLVEGICERVDTDGDSNQREDWDDIDSDNDCLLDRIESNTDRVIRAPIAMSDLQCATQAAMTGGTTRFCDTGSSACVSCSVDCSRNAAGSACLRRADGTLGCGCASSADCAVGQVCAASACTAVVRDAGGPDSGDAALDGAAGDGAFGDGSASDGAASDGAASDGAASDGAASDARASDAGASDASANDASENDASASDGGVGAGDSGAKDPAVMYGGGACACRVGAANATDRRAIAALFGAWLALAWARRKRARRAS